MLTTQSQSLLRYALAIPLIALMLSAVFAALLSPAVFGQAEQAEDFCLRYNAAGSSAYGTCIQKYNASLDFCNGFNGTLEEYQRCMASQLDNRGVTGTIRWTTSDNDIRHTPIEKSNLADNEIIEILVSIINVLSAGVGLVVIGMIVIGGIQYTSSRGNPQATAAAIGKITNAIIGLFLYLFMFALLQWLIPGGIFNG